MNEFFHNSYTNHRKFFAIYALDTEFLDWLAITESLIKDLFSKLIKLITLNIMYSSFDNYVFFEMHKKIHISNEFKIIRKKLSFY
jgi:hypothetical protein